MGAAPFTLALKIMSRGRGLKILVTVTAGFAILIYYSSQQVPAFLVLLFSVPAMISIMLSDSLLYESALYTLIIVGMEHKDLKIMEFSISLTMSTIISIPYLILGLTYFWLGEVLALTSSLLIMRWFESLIKSQFIM